MPPDTPTSNASGSAASADSHGSIVNAMIPVYRAHAAAQPSLVDNLDGDPKPKGPWSPWQYVVLIVIAILIAVFVVRPIGLQITGVFQRLPDAIQTGK